MLSTKMERENVSESMILGRNKIILFFGLGVKETEDIVQKKQRESGKCVRSHDIRQETNFSCFLGLKIRKIKCCIQRSKGKIENVSEAMI